jgi:hypothetical protein
LFGDEDSIRDFIKNHVDKYINDLDTKTESVEEIKIVLSTLNVKI